MRGGDNSCKTLAGSSPRPTTSAAAAAAGSSPGHRGRSATLVVGGGGGSSTAIGALKLTTSLKNAGMAAIVSNQLAEQARVAQSVNPTRTLRRTNSDFATPRRAIPSSFPSSFSPSPARTLLVEHSLLHAAARSEEEAPYTTPSAVALLLLLLL
eukprot:COSAG05_NODE_8546_length_694_cov_1.023529_1_plen_153_part_01